MCIRLQLWNSAIDAGTHNPWVGIGNSGNFNNYIRDVAIPKGLTTNYLVVKNYFGEPHNDLLRVFAAFGFPGMLGLLLIYLAPCAYLLPRLLNQQNTPEVRAAAAMGLAVCLGFMCFGLTETMFRRMVTAGFYTVLVALFMVLSEPRPAALTKQP